MNKKILSMAACFILLVLLGAVYSLQPQPLAHNPTITINTTGGDTVAWESVEETYSFTITLTSGDTSVNAINFTLPTGFNFNSVVTTPTGWSSSTGSGYVAYSTSNSSYYLNTTNSKLFEFNATPPLVGSNTSATWLIYSTDIASIPSINSKNSLVLNDSIPPFGYTVNASPTTLNWLTGNVTLTCFGAIDNESGLAANSYVYEYTENDTGAGPWIVISSNEPNTYTWDTSLAPDSSNITISCYVYDRAGNLGARATKNYAGIDNHAPFGTVFNSPAAGIWFNSLTPDPFTINCSGATDGTGSGVVSYTAGEKNSLLAAYAVINTTASGIFSWDWDSTGASDQLNWYLNCYATDYIGLDETPGAEITLAGIDVTAPTASIGSPIFFNNLTFPVWWDGNDSTSGIDHYDIYVDGAPYLMNTTDTYLNYAGTNYQTYVFTVVPTDVAGNIGANASTNTTIDITPPAMTIHSATPDPFSPNSDGAKENITIEYSTSDMFWAGWGIVIFNTTTWTINSTPIYVHLPPAFNNTSHANFVWDGTNSTGDGDYGILLIGGDMAGNVANDSVIVTLDTTPPVISSPFPTNNSVLSAGTTQTIVKVFTDEKALCRYSTTNSTFNFSTGTDFLHTNTGDLQHYSTVKGLANGKSYDYYIRCRDVAQNVNLGSYHFKFRIGSPSSPGGGGGSYKPRELENETEEDADKIIATIEPEYEPPAEGPATETGEEPPKLPASAATPVAPTGFLSLFGALGPAQAALIFAVICLLLYLGYFRNRIATSKKSKKPKK